MRKEALERTQGSRFIKAMFKDKIIDAVYFEELEMLEGETVEEYHERMDRLLEEGLVV